MISPSKALQHEDSAEHTTDTVKQTAATNLQGQTILQLVCHKVWCSRPWVSTNAQAQDSERMQQTVTLDPKPCTSSKPYLESND